MSPKRQLRITNSKSRRRINTAGIFAVVLIGVLLGGRYWASSAPVPAGIGLTTEGELRTCDSASNCVSTASELKGSRIDDFTCGSLTGQPLLQAVTEAFRAAGNTRVEATDGGYIHLVAVSSFWGFRDDIELHLQNTIVGVRSESRLGQGDLGVNRKRVDAARARLALTCAG